VKKTFFPRKDFKVRRKTLPRLLLAFTQIDDDPHRSRHVLPERPRPIRTKREQRIDHGGATFARQAIGDLRQIRLQRCNDRSRTDRRQIVEMAFRQKTSHRNAKARCLSTKIVGNRVVHRTEEHHSPIVGGSDGTEGQQRLQYRILRLAEGIVETAGWHKEHRQVWATDRARQTVELDLHHFRRARRQQENDRRMMVGDNLINDPIQFRLLFREVGFFDQRNAEAWTGENHDAEHILEQMGAGMRTKHEKETVLNLLVQPPHAGQTAKTMVRAIFPDHCCRHGITFWSEVRVRG
jgi:hypothetical protein